MTINHHEARSAVSKRSELKVTQKRCALDSGLDCCGTRTVNTKTNQVVCSQCAPAGISLDRLTDLTRDRILRGALYG